MYHYNGHELTKAEIRALRSADTICLDYYKGSGRIRAIRRKEHTDSGFEETVKVKVDTKIHIYGDREYTELDSESVTSCYEMVHFAQGEFWQTIAGVLKTGDVLRLDWTECGPDGGKSYVGGATTTTDSGSAVNAPLFWDRVDLRVVRQLKSGQKTLAFKVSSSHTPENSAKMIKRRNCW